MIEQRPMSPVARCLLTSHEFIMWFSTSRASCRVPPLGWSKSNMHPELIPQEAEAYGHERRAIYLLPFQQQTERPE